MCSLIVLFRQTDSLSPIYYDTLPYMALFNQNRIRQVLLFFTTSENLALDINISYDIKIKIHKCDIIIVLHSSRIK